MTIRKKEENIKAKKVLETLFSANVSTFKDQQAREKVIQFIQTELQPEHNDLAYKVSVDDTTKKHWKKSEHFFKVFYAELKHLTEYYSLTRKSKHFLQDLGEFLMWETNLLVDEEDEPLNQTDIAERLEVNVRTVQRQMNELIDKFVIIPIEIHRDTFYLVNPHVMFIGQNINIALPKLFEDKGYVSSKKANKKDSRSNRSKEQQKRITVG